MRIDMECYNNFVIKQEKMNKIYKKITGKNKKIPLTRIIKISSKQPIYLDDNELMKIHSKKGRKI